MTFIINKLQQPFANKFATTMPET